MTTFERERVKLFRLKSVPCFEKSLMAECEALSFADCENLWMPFDKFGSASNLAIEMLINHMYSSITKSMLTSGFAGVEFWVQKYEQGKGLAFHFDKDEKALQAHGTMKHPQYSSVVYLTGDRTRQRQGNILVFDGGHAHGVLESANVEDIRMTLLVNWWSEQPLGVPTPADATGETADALAGIQAQHVSERAGLAAAVDAAPAAAEALPCHCVFLKSLEEPIAVDQACEDQGVALRGAHAVDAVCFQHPGMSLVPLEVAEGDDVDCAAALLPFDSDDSS